MKKQIYLTKHFEKDVKKAERRGKKLSKLKEVIDLLEAEEKLPQSYCQHKLTGNYKNRWECHIEPDWLLIYKKTATMLVFERTGSHADLF